MFGRGQIQTVDILTKCLVVVRLDPGTPACLTGLLPWTTSFYVLRSINILKKSIFPCLDEKKSLVNIGKWHWYAIKAGLPEVHIENLHEMSLSQIVLHFFMRTRQSIIIKIG